MSKKRRNLIIMFAAVLVLGGLLWLVVRSESSDIDHTHSGEEEEEIVSDSESGILINEQQDDLRGIVFSNDRAKYTVSRDDSGEVNFSELKNLPVNHSFMEYVWYGVAQFEYSDIITTTDAKGYDAAAYGLDKPSLKVNATFSNDKKYEFIAGSNVPGSDSDMYYVLMSGDNTVYACSIDTPFFMGDSYYLSDDIFYSYDKDLENSSDIKIGDITLRGDNFSGDFVMKVNKQSNISHPFYGYDYVVTSPLSWPVKGSSGSMLVYDLTYLTADEALVLNPTEKQLKEYGFDSPFLTIEFERNGKSCTLYGGSITKSDMYVMLKGQAIIYRLNVESLSILQNLTPEAMYGANALSMAVEAVSGITVKNADFTKKIEISRKQNDNNSFDDVIYNYTAKVGGNEIKYTTYTNFLKHLNNSTIQSWNVKKPGGKPIATITVSYFENCERENDVIEIYKYSAREYAVVFGDYPVNTVSVTWYNQMIKNARDIQ